MASKCWTHVCGVPVQFGSIAALSVAMDAEEQAIYAARRAAASCGHNTAFEVRGRMIVMGDVPTDQKARNAASPLRAAGGPLLRGLVTHRLGYCESDR